MKKMWICCGALCMAFLLFCGSAMAADLTATVTVNDTKSGVSVVEESTKGKYTVTKSGVTEGDLYLVLFMSGTDAAPKPTSQNVYYMDVAAAKGTSVSFSAYPKEMGAGTYTVYLSDYSSSGAAKGVATITLAEASTPAASYKVTVASSSNGSVKSDKSSAAEGETVTLTITPADKYELDKLTVGGDDVTSKVSSGKYTFTMPGKDVSVSASFKTSGGSGDNPGGNEPGTVLYGDVNGDGSVKPNDRSVLARYLAGWDGYDESKINMANADVNADGAVKPNDRSILARHLAGWEGYETLPYKKS